MNTANAMVERELSSSFPPPQAVERDKLSVIPADDCGVHRHDPWFATERDRRGWEIETRAFRRAANRNRMQGFLSGQPRSAGHIPWLLANGAHEIRELFPSSIYQPMPAHDLAQGRDPAIENLNGHWDTIKPCPYNQRL